jgi:hypothetical protein
MTGPTQTSHEPTSEELARDGHGGHHPGDIPGEPHGVGDHGDHGETDGHGDYGHDAGEAPGPWDVQRWGAFVAGIALGLLVALCLAMTLALSPATGV